MTNALITGATGFLGGALARRLHAAGWQITATGRNRAAGDALQAAGLRFIPADLARDALSPLLDGVEVVFHCAALAAPWGREPDFIAANVTATERLVNACQRAQVRRLIHVSTPSIYFSGLVGRRDVREDAPLPPVAANTYAATKRQAEQIVDASGLPAITIRPRAIVGEGDPTVIPRIIRALERGRFPRIGKGDNLTDITYIENVVDSLLLCAAAPDTLHGRKFNITNGEPLLLWTMIERLAALTGLPPPRGSVPPQVAYGLATALEWAYRGRVTEPPLTRYTVGLLATDQTLNIDAARNDLGYVPRVSNAEAFERVAAGWR